MTIVNFVRSVFVAVFTLFVLPSVSAAQPLTIHGVNLEMDYEEVVSTLRARSRDCNRVERWQSSEGENFETVYCRSKNITLEAHADISVTATDRGKLASMRFECSATRTCGLEVDDIILALVHANVLPDGTSPINRLSNLSRFTFTDQNGNELIINADLRSEYTEQSIRLAVNKEKFREIDF